MENPAYVIDDYVYFCYRNQIKIKKRLYKILPDGTIKICSLFKELWLSLINTEDYVPPVTVCSPIYTLPLNNATELVGISNSDGFISWQSVSGYDGPIDDDGYPLSLFQLGLKFKLSWSSKQKVNISFYTSYNNLDDLAYPIIDNNNNLAIYYGDKGEFIIDNFDFIYARIEMVQQKINLRVEIIIPPNEPVKFIPGTKYLNFMYRGEKFRFPILKNFLSKDKLTVNVTVDPAMLKLQQQIIQTLTILSKKWPVTTLDVVANDVRDVQQLTYFNDYGGPSPVAGSKFVVKSYVNTYNYIENEIFERDWWWSVVSRGSERGNPTLGISIKPEFRQNKILRVSFDILVVADPRWITDSRIIVRPGLKMYTLQSGYVFYSYSDGSREIKKTFIANQGSTFTGSIDIPLGKTSTTLNCELSITANANIDVANTEFLTFKRVVINYV